MLASCEPGSGKPVLSSQAGIDIDMAGGAGTLAAAVGVDAGNVVVHRAAHHRQPQRHLDLMRRSVEFNVGDTRHAVLSPLGPRQVSGRRIYPPVAWFATPDDSLLRAGPSAHRHSRDEGFQFRGGP